MPRSEWLRAGGRDAGVQRELAEPPRLQLRAGEQVASQRATGIASPRDGTVFALDPDMPAQVQRIAFIGEAGQWWLDGRHIGSGASLAWAPWPGRHRLELKLDDGQTLGRVAFEVRGATLRR